MSIVWIAYDKKPPHLPVAVANTSYGLADMMGLKEKTIRPEITRWKNGNSHYEYERFAMVEVEDDND